METKDKCRECMYLNECSYINNDIEYCIETCTVFKKHKQENADIKYKNANLVQRNWIIIKYIIWHFLRKTFVGNVSAKKIQKRWDERYYEAEVNFEDL